VFRRGECFVSFRFVSLICVVGLTSLKCPTQAPKTLVAAQRERPNVSDESTVSAPPRALWRNSFHSKHSISTKSLVE
jgi:hypothetical protein